MATRRKSANDPWKQVSEPIEMANGTMAIHWRNTDTGDTRIVPAGTHPEDQPLSLQMLQTDEDDETPPEETATDRVAAMMQVAHGEDRAELKVYRIVQGQMEYCRGYKPEEFEDGNFDMLRDRFGAGEYEIRLYATHPTTRKFCVRSRIKIKIAPDNATRTGGSGMDSGMAQVLSTIAQGQQQMLEALVQIKQTPPKDPMEEMGKMMAMMVTMREAMGMNQTQSREKSSIGEIVSAIRELRNASEEISPEREPDSLMASLPKMLELITKGQEAQMQQPPAQFYPVTLPPSLQSTPKPIQAPEEPDQTPAPTPIPNETDDMKAFTFIKLRSYLKTLCDMAAAGDSKEKGAAFVYDNLPDELVEIMALANWFELLSTAASDCKAHKDWLLAVRDLSLAMFEEPDPA
jgi:hypothetical protein